MLFKFPRAFLAAASATSILALSGCVLPTSLPTSSMSGKPRLPNPLPPQPIIPSLPVLKALLTTPLVKY